MREDPGVARLSLVTGVAHLNEPEAVFEAMLTGWMRQQMSRGLLDATVAPRLKLVRRIQDFAQGYPWEWMPADLDDFTVSLMSGARRRELVMPDVVDLRPNPHMPQWVEEARWLTDPKDHPVLWVTERRSRVSVKQMDKRFRWIVAQAGLDSELTLHCLRRSYVTHLIEFGYPERFVQEQVGHAYASTTSIYTSVSNDFKNRTLKQALARVYGEGNPWRCRPILDNLIRDHLGTRGNASYASRDNGWLFPGGLPGKPLQTENVRAQLVALGIKPHDHRKTVPFQLAATIPTPVLADLIGIAPNTAVKWSALTSRGWSAYIAQR